MTNPVATSINIHSLGQAAGAATAKLQRLLDSQLLELAYQATSNTDVFVLLDHHGHYCSDASQHPPALVLFANKIDACLAKDVLNHSHHRHYTVSHCRLDTHPRMPQYTVGHALFALINHPETIQHTHCLVCVGYLTQHINGHQRFVSQQHHTLPDACFVTTHQHVLLRGFPFRDYFSALFTAYDGDDDIIKSMIAKLDAINRLSDPHILTQRVNILRAFLTDKLRPFQPSLRAQPQVVL